MTTLVYKFQIPDPSRPVPGASELSPSGELQLFHAAPLDPARVVGQRIDDVASNAGTYGMGGPGFFALKLGDSWLTIALWGAAAWMTCKGRLIEDLFHDTDNRAPPWISEADGIAPLQRALVDQAITGITIDRHALRIAISGGYDLTLDADPATRPVFFGNKQPRAFTAEDDLRRAVFLAPTTELWV
jgi:hypothetical protein